VPGVSSVTRYCPSCGLERREGERFCRNCGTPLGSGQTKLHASPVADPEPAQVTQPPTATPEAVPLPAPPSAPHPVVTPQRVVQPQPAPAASAARALPFKPVAVAAGALLVIGALLPWISGAGLTTSNALDVPVQSLWDLNATDGPIKVGFVTIALGLLGGGLSFVPRTAWVRRLCGSIALAVVAAFVLQFFRAVDQAGGSFGDVLESIGIGLYLSLAGAIGLQLSR
jgi:hypothetical protein